MSELNQEFSKQTLGDGELSNVLGTGADINTGQETANLTNPHLNPPGIGNTFLTEPLHAQFVTMLEEASFVRQIAKTVAMDQPTLRVPAITSGLEVYYQGEQGQEATQTTMSAGDFTLEARKIMAQVLATAELYEDSQQNIEQIITGDFVRAIAQAEEQAFLLGRVTKSDGTAIAKGSLDNSTVSDKTAPITGNNRDDIQALTQFVRGGVGYTVGTDKFQYAHWGTQTGSWTSTDLSDASPIATSPLNICDGVVTVALDEGNFVDMQQASFRGGTAYKAIREAIFRLGLLGRDRGQLILILNPVASNQLLQSDELMTLDKYGSNATILTGEVGSLFGVKIIESSFMPSAGIKTTGSGDAVWGKGGYGVLVHKPSLLLGDLRKVQVENERIIQNDAYRTVISERLAFGMERRNGAVAIGNINSDVTSLSSGTSVFIAGGLAPSISGNSSADIVTTTASTVDTVLTIANIEDGESYSATVFTYTSTGTVADCELSISAVAGPGMTNVIGGDGLGSGSTATLGTANANGSATITVTATVGANDTLDVDDVATAKIAIFDGNQTSNVHTLAITAVAPPV